MGATQGFNTWERLPRQYRAGPGVRASAWKMDLLRMDSEVADAIYGTAHESTSWTTEEAMVMMAAGHVQKQRELNACRAALYDRGSKFPRECFLDDGAP